MENTGKVKIDGVDQEQFNKKIIDSTEDSMVDEVDDYQTDAPEESPVDMERVKKAMQALEDMRKENSTKEYLVKMDVTLLEFYENFMNYQAPWKGKEALGVFEVLKKIEKIKSDGIKNNSIYLNNLHIEATHYFLTKYEGKGSDLVPHYVQIYKNIEDALQRVAADNQKAKDLEKELVAAQQGIETC